METITWIYDIRNFPTLEDLNGKVLRGDTCNHPIVKGNVNHLENAEQ